MTILLSILLIVLIFVLMMILNELIHIKRLFIMVFVEGTPVQEDPTEVEKNDKTD